VAQAARAFGVSRQTVYKWLNRFEEGGRSALVDRSSRPRRIPVQTPTGTIQRMKRLRCRKKPAWEIAQELGVPYPKSRGASARPV
jgi:transposase